jgi:hypothetical protein
VEALREAASRPPGADRRTFIAPLPGSKKKHYLAEEWTREELWPDKEHVGLPVLLSGGEEGRLLRFEHHDDPVRWPTRSFGGNAVGDGNPIPGRSGRH